MNIRNQNRKGTTHHEENRRQRNHDKKFTLDSQTQLLQESQKHSRENRNNSKRVF